MKPGMEQPISRLRRAFELKLARQADRVIGLLGETVRGIQRSNPNIGATFSRPGGNPEVIFWIAYKLGYRNAVWVMKHLPLGDADLSPASVNKMMWSLGRAEQMTGAKVSPKRQRLYGELQAILDEQKRTGQGENLAQATRVLMNRHDWSEHQRSNFARAAQKRKSQLGTLATVPISGTLL